MASAEAEIRHVFGATCLTEGSIGAAPPDIVKLSGDNREQRGHLFAHASEGQCVEYANCEILAKLKIELSVNITKYQLI